MRSDTSTIESANAPARAMRNEEPRVGVAHTRTEASPRNAHQYRPAEMVKEGVPAIGGTPLEFKDQFSSAFGGAVTRPPQDQEVKKEKGAAES